MSKFIRSIHNSVVKKNLISLFSSELVVRLGNFIVIILIARSFTVDEFGKLNYVIILSGYFLYLINFGFDIHGIKSVAKEPLEIDRIFSKITSLKIYSACISSIIYLVIIFQITEEQKFNLAVLYLLIFLSAALNPYWIFQAVQKMEYVLKFKIYESLGYLIIISSVIILNKSLYFVPISLFVAQFGSFYLAHRFIHKKMGLKLKLAKHIKQDLKNSVPIGFASFFALIYLNSDVIMLEYFYSDKEVGVYSTAIKLFTLLIVPFQIIFSVFLPKLSEKNTQQPWVSKKSFKDLLKTVSIYSISAAIVVTVLAGNIIELIFGTDYIDSVFALQILAIDLLIVGFSSVLSNLLISNNFQKNHMFALLSGALINVMLNFLVIPVYSYNGAAVTTIISETVVAVILFYFYKKKIGMNFDKLVT